MPRSLNTSMTCGAVVLLSMATMSFAQTPGNSTPAPVTTPLHRAVERDDVAEVARLIRAGSDIKATNRYGVAPISLACARGNAAIVDILLQAGADANTALPEGETCLMSAAKIGRASCRERVEVSEVGVS